jgi:hypothetical protein
MDPISPVVEGQAEVTFTGDGCRDLPALPLLDVAAGGLMIVTRWQPSAEDLARLNAGGSVYLFQFTDGAKLQPVAIETEPPDVENVHITPSGIVSVGVNNAADREIWEFAQWLNGHAAHGAPAWACVGVNLDVDVRCPCGQNRVTNAPALDTLAPAWKTSWRTCSR